MPAPVYFDSSVFLSIFMGESSGPSIKQLLQELTRDKTKIYTSIITIQEVSVHAFRRGARPTDNYSKVSKLARIHGLTKEMALTAAKFDAQLIDPRLRRIATIKRVTGNPLILRPLWSWGAVPSMLRSRKC